MTCETERTKMAVAQRAAPLPEVEGGRLWALTFFPDRSINLDSPAVLHQRMNTNGAKAEAVELDAAWVMV
jgi:hypothetical protein